METEACNGYSGIKHKKVKNGTYKVVKIIAEFSFLKEEWTLTIPIEKVYVSAAGYTRFRGKKTQVSHHA